MACHVADTSVIEKKTKSDKLNKLSIEFVKSSRYNARWPEIKVFKYFIIKKYFYFI